MKLFIYYYDTLQILRSMLTSILCILYLIVLLIFTLLLIKSRNLYSIQFYHCIALDY